MWPLDDELTVWFDEVMAARGSPAPGGSQDEKPPLEQNELTKHLKVKWRD